MNYPFPVGSVERLGDLNRQRERSIERNRTALQALGKRLALEELHDQVGHAVFLTDVVNRADVRVTETGDRARFALEPLELHRRRRGR